MTHRKGGRTDPSDHPRQMPARATIRATQRSLVATMWWLARLHVQSPLIEL